METSERRGGGRPRIGEEGARAGEYVGFKAGASLKEKLDASAGSADRSLSGETRHRVEMSFQGDDLLAQATMREFGPDNGALVSLVGYIAQEVAPHGEWRDDRVDAAILGRWFQRALDRLRDPHDINAVAEAADAPGASGALEVAVDAFLHRLGDHPEPGKAPTATQRWATAKRERLGDLGERLVYMHRRVEAWRRERVPRQASPEAVQSWVDAHERAAALDPIEQETSLCRQDIAFARGDEALPGDERLRRLRRAVETMAWLGTRVDAATLAELRAGIAEAAAVLGVPGAEIVQAVKDARTRRQQREAERAKRRETIRARREAETEKREE